MSQSNAKYWTVAGWLSGLFAIALLVLSLALIMLGHGLKPSAVFAIVALFPALISAACLKPSTRNISLRLVGGITCLIMLLLLINSIVNPDPKLGGKDSGAFALMCVVCGLIAVKGRWPSGASRQPNVDDPFAGDQSLPDHHAELRWSPEAPGDQTSTQPDTRPAWKKIFLGAAATPIIVGLFFVRALAKGGNAVPINTRIVTLTLIASAGVGAFLGGLLAVKDHVDRRIAAGQSVALPLRLLFGLGLWSLLGVWFPLVIVAVLAITTLVLTIRL